MHEACRGAGVAVDYGNPLCSCSSLQRRPHSILQFGDPQSPSCIKKLSSKRSNERPLQWRNNAVTVVDAKICHDAILGSRRATRVPHTSTTQKDGKIVSFCISLNVFEKEYIVNFVLYMRAHTNLDYYCFFISLSLRVFHFPEFSRKIRNLKFQYFANHRYSGEKELISSQKKA